MTRVVLVRLSALGDIVHAWPVAEAIRAARPDIHLTWVVERALEPLVDGHPAVDAVMTARTGNWRRKPWSGSVRAEIAAFRTRLHELQPDVALDLQGTVKSALVSRWTGAPRRIGLARPWRREWLAGLATTETVAGAGPGHHVVDTNLALLAPLGVEPPRSAQPDGRWLLETARRPEGPWDEPYAVVLPGTGGAHKVLPIATLGEVCRGLAALELAPVVLWGPGERQRAEEVVEAGGDAVRLTPPTDILEMAAVLGGAAVVIGADTGPVHLAASLAVPTVGVFLASDWRRNGPLGRRTAVISGAVDRPRAPSGSARVPAERAVGAGEIVAAARDLLEGVPR